MDSKGTALAAEERDGDAKGDRGSQSWHLSNPK